jgi:hypothetical protein
MTVRIPLVLVSGRVQELSSGDSINVGQLADTLTADLTIASGYQVTYSEILDGDTFSLDISGSLFVL